MKEVRKIIIVDLIILLIKLVGGLLCHSLTMLASMLLEVSVILVSLFLYKKSDNKKYKGIISSVIGLLIILSGLFLIYYGVVSKVRNTSWFIILFVFLVAITRYIISCFSTNMSYQKKEGLLVIGKLNSTVDFVTYGIVLGALVLTKLSRWVKIFKYGDILGMILISLLVIYKGIKVIINSFKYLEEKNNIDLDSYIKEVEKNKEIKSVEKLEINSYGGFNYAHLNIMLKEGVSMIDVNSLVITIQDYLLKISDLVRINLVKKTVIRKAKVRSKKADARNSRGRNSKTNTKKKNTKKKNSKH